MSLNIQVSILDIMWRWLILIMTFQESKKSKHGKAPHSSWCNYDDLNEYFWCGKIFNSKTSILLDC